MDPSVFSKVTASEAIPVNWEDRARKAWEYYVEEPLVKNCVNSWRSFAVGDEIKVASDDEKVKEAASEMAYKIGVSAFVKDMILQLLVKEKAISLNMTKQDVIELLDEIEPGVDHSGLQGQELIAAKEKHSIGPLKNKQQLVKAIEKSAGQDLAEKAKKEVVEAVRKETKRDV